MPQTTECLIEESRTLIAISRRMIAQSETDKARTLAAIAESRRLLVAHRAYLTKAVSDNTLCDYLPPHGGDTAEA